MKAGNTYELPFWQNQSLVIGIDEAGRGPIAGPLVVSGVVLPPGFDVDGIYDSKALKDEAKESLFRLIVKEALFYCIIVKDAAFVDQHNIYQSTKLAMMECVKHCPLILAGALTDAMPLPVDSLEVIPIIKGDQKSISIAAASILAKVTRDSIMKGYDLLFPQYQFAKHKGYPTKQHLDLLQKHGASAIHRSSYAPVANLAQLSLFDDEMVV